MSTQTAAAVTQQYAIDPDHSAVTFRVRHMVISKVSGRFRKFSGTIRYAEGQPATWSASAEIDAASVDTHVEARDAHLKSADFLDVARFPTIGFKSRGLQAAKDGRAVLLGDLTLHGVTRPVAMDLEIGGAAADPWGGRRLGAAATTTISRKDFGLTWNQALETGGLLVGDEIEISLEIEGVAAAPTSKL